MDTEGRTEERSHSDSGHQTNSDKTSPSGAELRFSPRALELSAQLKAKGLSWEPTAGQFVWDEDGVLPHTSPFQDRVFFILDLKHFLRYAGSVDAMQRRMRWLPAWHDARCWLTQHGVDDVAVAQRLSQNQAIEKHCELEVLYEMILEQL